MFNADRPIKYIHEDMLNRKGFAESIGEAILKSQTKDSIVIGLLGKWGSGKTSLINMVVEYINDISKSFDSGKKPIVVYFNPWNFSEQNQLINQFFNQLSSSLERIDYSDSLKEAGKLLKNYAKIIKPFTYIPSVGTTASFFFNLCKVTSEVAESSGEILENDLNGIKNDLSNLLEKQDSKIIIIFDDIDRLNEREVRQVFQLIKSLADFPNTVYLLTFDKEIVKKALEKDLPGNGTEYLEKIVQVPLDIPLISANELEKLLTIQIDRIFENARESELDRVYWGNVYQSGFKNFFENIRDVTRYINVLSFSYDLVKGEVNPVDFIAITAIQVFSPEVYKKIRENKEVFTCLSTSVKETKTEHKQICDEIINSADTKIQKFLLDYLTILFPNIDSIYGNTFYNKSYEKSWILDRRICSKRFFDVYFKFSVPNWEISQKELTSIIDSGNDREKFTDKLIELMQYGKILRFLAIFPDHASKIKEDNIGNIVSSILDIGDLFPDDESIFYGTPMRIHLITNFLIKRLDLKIERFNILEKSITDNTRSLYTFIWELDFLDESYGRYHYKKRETSEKDLIISEDQLDTLEKLVCNKIETWAQQEKLESHPKIVHILQKWREWGADKKDIDNVIRKVILNDKNLINFISYCISPVFSHTMGDYVGKTTWRISYVPLEEFFDLNDIQSRLNNISALNKFETMTDKEKLAVELFLDNLDKYKLNPSQKVYPLFD